MGDSRSFKLMLSFLLMSACSTVDDSTDQSPPIVKSIPPPVLLPAEPTPPKPPRRKVPSIDSLGYSAKGQASWYDVSMHGKKTASGEIYDLYEITAAHATLPLMSHVRVVNLHTGRSIIVKINDRLPANAHSLIQLSYGAAKRLDLINQSTPSVKVHGLPPQSLPSFR